MTEEEVDELLQTNLTSTIWGCRFVGRQMMQRQVKAQRQSREAAEGASQRKEEQPFGGAIINVASVLAQRGMVGTSMYSAAKAGILGMSLVYSVCVCVCVCVYVEVMLTLPPNRSYNLPSPRARTIQHSRQRRPPWSHNRFRHDRE